MSDLIAARSQMAISLAFHIVFAAVGIGMPVLMAIAEWMALRTGDEACLALARRELGKVGEITPPEFDWDWEPVSTFLDALAALGDRERIEAEAPNWLQQGTFAEPFALRALGIARSDRALLQQALGRFELMGLSWHAEQTRRLL